MTASTSEVFLSHYCSLSFWRPRKYAPPPHSPQFNGLSLKDADLAASACHKSSLQQTRMHAHAHLHACQQDWVTANKTDAISTRDPINHTRQVGTPILRRVLALTPSRLLTCFYRKLFRNTCDFFFSLFHNAIKLQQSSQRNGRRISTRIHYVNILWKIQQWSWNVKRTYLTKKGVQKMTNLLRTEWWEMQPSSFCQNEAFFFVSSNNGTRIVANRCPFSATNPTQYIHQTKVKNLPRGVKKGASKAVILWQILILKTRLAVAEPFSSPQ